MIKEIDCRGLNCPQPVINTKKALDEIQGGRIITIVDNEIAKENIRKLAKKMNVSANIREEDSIYYITMNKGENTIEELEVNPNASLDATSGNGEFVILIGNDKMGEGSDELGEILMRSYLYTLTEVEPKPHKLIFLNRGVKLNCLGSPSIENIKKMADMGIEILSCGTCLDYYGLKEDLQVGSISNMYSIVESLNEASKTIIL